MAYGGVRVRRRELNDTVGAAYDDAWWRRAHTEGAVVALPALEGVEEPARDAARERGVASEACTSRCRARVRRDPQGFAAVLQQLMADQAWEVPAASGSLPDRWPEIAATGAGRLAEYVRAVAFCQCWRRRSVRGRPRRRATSRRWPRPPNQLADPGPASATIQVDSSSGCANRRA
ncbi:hypothetical protein JBE27_05870 [Streptomyces albiflaviniger]|nr:hypothetical protein [Streptomyces albiflaviniger]